MAVNLEIKKLRIDAEVLDFGIYNRHLYFIDPIGQIRFNRLLSSLNSFFQSREISKKSFSKIIAKDESYSYEINDFPIDSLVFGKDLLVATSDSVVSIPFPGKKGFSRLNKTINVPNVISLAKLGNWLFLSRDSQGLTIINPDLGRLDLPDWPSTRVEINGNNILCIHPDFSPKALKHYYFWKIPHRPLHEIADSRSGILVVDEVANESFEESQIKGRDVIVPLIADNEAVLYGPDGETFRVRLNGLSLAEKRGDWDLEVMVKDVAACKRDDGKEQVLHINDYHIPFQFLLENLLKDDVEEYPSEVFCHRHGLIAQYWDHVEYIDAEGHHHNLVEGSEISRVKIYPSYSVYSSFITVATEDNCWIIRVN